jgi:DNA-binding NarL/FixJ family response regulator
MESIPQETPNKSVAKSLEEALRPREEDTGDMIIIDIGLPDYPEDDLSDLEPVFRGGNAPALRETQEGLSKTQASLAPYSLRLKGPIAKGFTT